MTSTVLLCVVALVCKMMWNILHTILVIYLLANRNHIASFIFHHFLMKNSVATLTILQTYSMVLPCFYLSPSYKARISCSLFLTFLTWLRSPWTPMHWKSVALNLESLSDILTCIFSHPISTSTWAVFFLGILLQSTIYLLQLFNGLQ